MEKLKLRRKEKVVVKDMKSVGKLRGRVIDGAKSRAMVKSKHRQAMENFPPLGTNLTKKDIIVMLGNFDDLVAFVKPNEELVCWSTPIECRNFFKEPNRGKTCKIFSEVFNKEEKYICKDFTVVDNGNDNYTVTSTNY